MSDAGDTQGDAATATPRAEGESPRESGAGEVASALDAQRPEGGGVQDDEEAGGEVAAVEDKGNGIDFAAANGDFDDDSELSDLDEEQFRDFDDAAPEGQEPAVFALPSFRKKKGGAAGRKERRARGPRRGSDSEDDDDAGRIYSDDETRPSKARASKNRVPEPPTDAEEFRKWKLDRQMDAALAGKRKRKKKDEDELIASMDEEIVALTEKMRLAALADAQANADKKIATQKLRLLPEVQKILRSQALYDSILDNNMLVSMKHWLEPLPDRSLPALNIQRAIFEALAALPIKTEHLRESGIGKVVLFYKKSKKPEDAIRTAANTLVSEWSRPIIRKSASHKTKRVRTVDYDGPSSVPRLHATPSQEALSGGNQYRSKGGTSIPRGERAYDVAPRARDIVALQQTTRDGSGSGGGNKDDSAYRRITNTLKDLGKQRNAGRKGGVSIEGRGIA